MHPPLNRALLLWPLLFCAAMAKQVTTSPTTAPVGPELRVSDLHNVHKLTSGIYCGSGPESEADFKALAALGIRTVISVDGTRPEAQIAATCGLRYVHLPFGYDGIPREKELEIGRAVRDLPGPFYIHCHHGLHRGPTAAVVAAMTVDGWTADQAVAALHALGTSPQYQGLYASARDFHKPTQQELDRADDSFPAVAKLDDLSDTMVQIDHRWDALKASQKAGWTATAAHPDADPPHEALLLEELFREAHRPGGPAQGRPADVLDRLSQAEIHAQQLEAALRAGNRPAADVAAKAVDNACASCHTRYRNPPLKDSHH